MSRVIFVLIMCVAINACSTFAPYIDRKRNAGQPLESLYVGKSELQSPVVCYNSLTSTPKEVIDLAIEECKKNKTGSNVEFVKQTYWTCSLLNPNMIYFNCVE